MKKVTVKELSKIVENSEEVYILDVRNPDEVEVATLNGVNIPLGQLHDRYDQVPAEKTIYCLCHHGVRSQMAQDFLVQRGYSDVINIEGGIDAWSIEIDESIPRY